MHQHSIPKIFFLKTVPLLISSQNKILSTEMVYENYPNLFYIDPQERISHISNSPIFILFSKNFTQKF